MLKLIKYLILNREKKFPDISVFPGGKKFFFYKTAKNDVPFEIST